MTQQEIDSFVGAALECSVYAAPLEPGLTYEELLEVGKRVGLQKGEIADSLSRAAFAYFDGTLRLRPDDESRSWHGNQVFRPKNQNTETLAPLILCCPSSMSSYGVKAETQQDSSVGPSSSAPLQTASRVTPSKSS